MFGDSIITPHPPKYLSPLPPSLQTHYHCLNSGSHYPPPRIFQSLPPPISLGCVENHLPETEIYQANAVSSPSTVPYCLKSDLLEKSIQSLPTPSCFSHNLLCSLSSLTLDPPRTSLTHNADPGNVCTHSLGSRRGRASLVQTLWQTPTSSFQSQAQNHFSMKPFTNLLPTQINYYLFFAASGIYTFFTLHRDHTLAGVTNTNTHRTNQVS